MVTTKDIDQHQEPVRQDNTVRDVVIILVKILVITNLIWETEANGLVCNYATPSNLFKIDKIIECYEAKFDIIEVILFKHNVVKFEGHALALKVEKIKC